MLNAREAAQQSANLFTNETDRKRGWAEKFIKDWLIKHEEDIMHSPESAHRSKRECEEALATEFYKMIDEKDFHIHASAFAHSAAELVITRVVERLKKQSEHGDDCPLCAMERILGLPDGALHQ